MTESAAQPLRQSNAAGRPAVFLDRDGTINVEVEYLGSADQLQLIAGAGQAIARLNQAGMAVIVATNQAGVARGYFAESAVHAVHQRLDQLLQPHGAHVDRYLFCPHHPTAGQNEYRQDCDCRKPLPGMLTRAAAEMGLDLARSVMIGDKLSDLQAGAAAGCRTILVRTGYGAEHERAFQADDVNLLAVADTLADAVELWLAAGTSAGNYSGLGMNAPPRQRFK